MKIPVSVRYSAALVAACFAVAAFSPLRAQTEVAPVQPIQPVQPAQPVQPVQPIAPVQSIQPVAPAPGEHVAEIQITVSRGSVQAYFGRAPRNEKIEIGAAELKIKVPSTASVTKLASRDKTSDGSKRVTPDNPWAVRVSFAGPGRYVFNIVEWDGDPVITSAVVKIDGVVMFSGRGSEDNFNGWAEKFYAPNVNKTGSREIAFVLP